MSDIQLWGIWSQAGRVCLCRKVAGSAQLCDVDDKLLPVAAGFVDGTADFAFCFRKRGLRWEIKPGSAYVFIDQLDGADAGQVADHHGAAKLDRAG